MTELLFFASVGDIKRVERIVAMWNLKVADASLQRHWVRGARVFWSLPHDDARRQEPPVRDVAERPRGRDGERRDERRAR